MPTTLPLLAQVRGPTIPTTDQSSLLVGAQTFLGRYTRTMRTVNFPAEVNRPRATSGVPPMAAEHPIAAWHQRRNLGVAAAALLPTVREHAVEHGHQRQLATPLKREEAAPLLRRQPVGPPALPRLNRVDVYPMRIWNGSLISAPSLAKVPLAPADKNSKVAPSSVHLYLKTSRTLQVCHLYL